jgi:hypothetical protein
MPARFTLLFITALAAAPLFAAQSTASRAYLDLKQDDSLYVGEATEALKDFSGREKALESARTQARAALAESVRVEVSSSTTENSKAEDGKVSEEVEHEAQSSSHVELENVKMLELDDYPDKGMLTVLASLSKEDYRRQLAGKKVAVYLPEHGLRLGASYLWPASLDPLKNHYEGLQTGGDRQSDNHLAYSLDFLWRSCVLGMDYEPTEFGGLEFYSLGYEWTPWDTRLQPWIPVRAELSGAEYQADWALSWGASAGLGLRYWFTEGLAFEISGVWHQSLGQGAFSGLQLSPGVDASYSMSALEEKISVQWSGF